MMMLSNPQSFSKDVNRLYSNAKILGANEIGLHLFSNIIGFSAICIADLLSVNTLIGSVTGKFNSASNLANHTNSATRAARLLYSASAELLLTICYFLDFQEIKESPSFTTYPVTDLRVL
ncbi:hypothetical protein R3W88_013331 [Solanum pinnatisectum]|uniref:Uncharacterized protein n=1 Tax=Solanum pinnatisectum TaxID=50273 RepID=A0AAV9LC28_9SOLN|nr:hypothetical protein R3W88_013331 [Solanum pinnatisectum]